MNWCRDRLQYWQLQIFIAPTNDPRMFRMADHKYTDLIKLSTPVPRWHYKQWTEAREFVRGVAGHQSIWVGHPRLAIMVGITLAVSFAALPLTLPTLLWGPFSYS